MGREVRRVPVNWNHPKDKKGKFIPLKDDYIGALKYYRDDVDSFIKQMTKIIKKGSTKLYDNIFNDSEELYDYLTEDSLEPPDIKEFMPSGSWYQLYENVSEGTPLSPTFEKPEELVDWLTNNKDYWGTQWTKEGAEHIVNSGFAMSGILSNGRIYKPEEQYLINKNN